MGGTRDAHINKGNGSSYACTTHTDVTRAGWHTHRAQKHKHATVSTRRHVGMEMMGETRCSRLLQHTAARTN
jgi:hypothetical protein